ncbi:uncharacterized protein [Triticum aestivum]|uniref:uncharacterized protein n=1 Tax=Triticum aestivum TaxID=4565 RepID=UPI000843B143|nr:uncharacterized protein LOC123169612 [Triticum aestivum]
MAASGSCLRRSPWQDLPAELLGLVLLRLPSHADRIRLPAVCCAWRSGARLQHPLPPLLPWLALPDGTFLSLPDGAVHSLAPVPDDVFYGFSTGGALFLVHEGRTFSLMSPSSEATVTLPEPPFWFPTDKISKVAVSNHLVAVLRDSRVSVYTRGGGAAWASTRCMEWAPPAYNSIADIALFQGKLYVLTGEDELHVLDAGDQQITDVCCIRKIPTPSHDYYDLDNLWNNDDYYHGTDMRVRRDYLVVAGNQLLRVELMIVTPAVYPPWRVDTGIDPQQTYRFHVFEAADLSCGHGRWRDVSTLMGRALFVSQSCSESVPAAAGNQFGHAGVREDCIYFVNKDDSTMCWDWPRRRTTHDENPFLDSGVYNMRDQTVSPLPLETSGASTLRTCDGIWPPAWLFPKT